MTDIDIVERLRSEAANYGRTCGDLFDEAATLISQLRNRLSDLEGWRLAPLEPTHEMIMVGLKAAEDDDTVPLHSPTKHYDWLEISYRAMLSASPSPPIHAVEIDGEKERG